MSDLGYYFERMRELPFREVVKRAADLLKTRMAARAGYLSARFFGTRMSDTEFLKKGLRSAPDLQQMPDLVRHFRERSGPAFFISASRRDETVPLIASQFQAGKDKTIAQADKVCDHLFNLLGSGDAALGEEIDWHRDFKSAFSWSSNTYYKDIAIPYGKADIKVPWELSRFSHAITLGQAFWLTEDERYAREFVGQVADWIENNRPRFGPNWACTMDVAIRACNWIAGYSFFLRSPSITDAFLSAFLKSLYQHGRHIRANLEYSDSLTSNHYLSNIVGLVYLGVLFPEFREAAEWKEFGISELRNEMQKQVYPDGCDFEASTCYHRLVLELFFFPAVLIVLNDANFTGDNHRGIAEKIFGREFADRLYRMFEAVLYLLMPNGRMPQIGDNDSGRLHIFAEREVLDMRYLLTFGAIFFQEPKFRIREFGFSEEALWVFGTRGFEIWNDLGEQELRDITSRAFPDAGWYIMRNNRDCLIVSCGPNGQNGNGGHAHNDKLSFELCLDGFDIFVDPGTYIYTPEPEMRNFFRSTASHNTVALSGLEQNRLDSGLSLFHLRDDARARITQWETKDGCDLLSGEHFGFAPSGYHHQRTITFIKPEGSVTMIDTVRGKRPQSIACFHLLPGGSVTKRGEGIFSLRNTRITFTGNDRIEISEAWYSPEYGRKEESICMKVFFGNALKTVISKEKSL